MSEVWLRVGLFGANEIRIDPAYSIVAGMFATAFAGSYHINAMDQNFRDYISVPYFPPLPASSGIPSDFPISKSFRAILQKQSSTGVIGNIGESIGGYVARDKLGLPISAIVHVVSTRKTKAPDFLFRIGGRTAFMKRLKSMGVSSQPLSSSPAWWPAESKARSAKQGAVALREAFQQLVAYWFEEVLNGGNIGSVGYGIVISYLYSSSVNRVTIHVLVPRRPADLRKLILAAVQKQKSSGRYLSARFGKTKTQNSADRILSYQSHFHG